MQRPPTPWPSTLLTLLQPRGQMMLFVALLEIGLVLGWLAVTQLSAPIWAAAMLVLVLILVPAIRKWQADRAVFGWPLTVMSILLATQSLHTIEHIAQWVQYHLLNWPLKASSGIISPLNAEFVHFGWNWAVLLTVVYLLRSGMNTTWMWLLFVWAAAHSAEHSYMFSNYLASGGVQGLPGFLGKGGWLALNAGVSAPLEFICRQAPALIEAPRLDVHFWWNTGEIALLILSAHSVIVRRARDA
jgi:hypothetical protein